MRGVRLGAVALSVCVVMLGISTPADAGPEPLPDFVVESITTDPLVPPANYLVPVTVTIRNDGGVCYQCQPVSIDFYAHRLTPPPRNVTGDLGCLILAPAPGARIECTGSLRYPGNGDYSMWAQVDTFNAGTESDENNVLGPQTLTVAPPPVLRVLSVELTPASPLQHQPVDVAVTIRNLGNDCNWCGPASVDFYKASNQPPGPNQAGDLACSLPVPASGATATCTGSVTYTHSSTWHAWAQVDRLNTVFEGNADYDHILGPKAVTVRPDSDADSLENSADNCPYWANPSQAVPTWPVPAGDSDCDGLSDAREEYIGTDPFQQCADTPGANNEPPPDRWPFDMNDNQIANTLDVGQFVFSLNSRSNQSPPDPRWNQRHDFNANGIVNTLDVGAYVFVLNRTCSNSGP